MYTDNTENVKKNAVSFLTYSKNFCFGRIGIKWEEIELVL